MSLIAIIKAIQASLHEMYNGDGRIGQAALSINVARLALVLPYSTRLGLDTYDAMVEMDERRLRGEQE